ncbi:ATP-binding cassette domain-containing protein, partial [Staphylococcus aureus]|uniref:ATP-binding cassette domain-containing protein n=1 Tax=Staphylococcus aureus TaxID=1280 RepID=UPI001C837535
DRKVRDAARVLELEDHLERKPGNLSGGQRQRVADGRRVNEAAPKDRNLAMVFQNYALYPHLTVYENIAFPLRLIKDNKPSDEEIDRKVRDAARVLELEDHLERKPGNLSGGQRQRVA